MRTLSVLFIFCAFMCYSQDKTIESGQDSTSGEFYYLFDGKNVEHWHGTNSTDFPHHCWNVTDGVLKLLKKSLRKADNCGHLITRKKYSDFELELEFKLEPRANSGIKYFYRTETGLGLEYQIIDDRHHGATHRTADLYDVFECREKKLNPPGQWNKVRILVKGMSVEHWLNGIRVLEYERGSQKFKKHIDQSKFKDNPNFGMHEDGHIMLQDHGGGVAFRNIRIRELYRMP